MIMPNKYKTERMMPIKRAVLMFDAQQLGIFGNVISFFSLTFTYILVTFVDFNPMYQYNLVLLFLL